MKIYSSTYKDQAAIVLESDRLRVKFLPDSGANIASIFDKQTNREFMVQRQEDQYRKGTFDGVYVDAECSGFDDMFPTIDECYYDKLPWKGIRLSDHGEVWSLKSETEIGDEQVRFRIQGIRLPYIFEKTAKFTQENVLTLTYKVINPTQFDMDFVWAAHTMLQAEVGLELFVPKDCIIGQAVFSKTGRIGSYGEEFDYPMYTDKQGEIRKINVMGEWEDNSEKYYFKNKLTEGWCAVRYPDGTVFGLDFPAQTVPYLGILHNPGGWRDIFNIFLEPCTAPFDRPDVANIRGQGSVVKANSTCEWYLNILVDESSAVHRINAVGLIIK